MRGCFAPCLMGMDEWLTDHRQLQNPIQIGYGGGQNLKVSYL